MLVISSPNLARGRLALSALMGYGSFADCTDLITATSKD
jgi:hypothetical protein